MADDKPDVKTDDKPDVKTDDKPDVKTDDVTHIVYTDKDGKQRRVTVAAYIKREKDGEL